MQTHSRLQLLRQGRGRSGEHRGDHAVVLLPGAAAAEEGDEEDHQPHRDDEDGGSGGRRVADLVGVVHSDLNQDADNDQGDAAELPGTRSDTSSVCTESTHTSTKLTCC